MKKVFAKTAMAGLIAGSMALTAAPASAEIQKLQLKAIGTWSNLTPYIKFEKPFYTKGLKEASGGKISAKFNGIVELGLKGWEVMRLVKLGLFDVAHGVYGYVSSEDAALEGVDLSGAPRDPRHGREIVKAYEPIISKHFVDTFDAHYLMTFRWATQQVFCNQPITSIADLKGKKVRVYSTTLGDIDEGLGGTSVTIAFAEVVPALQKGVADCGITGTMPAYQAKWHEVITHTVNFPVGTGAGFAAMSNRTWNKLNDDTKGFLTDQYNKMSDQIWKDAEEEDAMAYRCLSGNGDCPLGKPGSVTLVEPGERDMKAREAVLKNFVLKRWAQRCGDDCTKNWNDTAGKVVGVMASK